MRIERGWDVLAVGGGAGGTLLAARRLLERLASRSGVPVSEASPPPTSFP